ncbi:hypothetical protein LRP52_35985 [Photobacterium sp. ZSDE20]|uniref:Uncharacterized protein n=1 Tax=Photobacterium pectinilyticum TaxID=2906793 RepID=A0ABT1N5X0_9GAMM|nr:hypothetical protein [Photobacterium sp. ZSDE20]MCQ1060130.1 hypothetical protein [Photobacterium sp. ZSDE20]MDD1827586.1 hypothetical protein [Photobacterium sp. ZSDE20]
MEGFQAFLQFVLDNALLTAFWLFVAWRLIKARKAAFRPHQPKVRTTASIKKPIDIRKYSYKGRFYFTPEEQVTKEIKD